MEKPADIFAVCGVVFSSLLSAAAQTGHAQFFSPVAGTAQSALRPSDLQVHR